MTDTLPQRIEAAEGADRELDLEIARAKGWTEYSKGWFVLPGMTEHYHISELPRYTASIDAALTLVPEGWDWFRWSPGSMVVSKPHESEKLWAITVEATAATPALALCAAALRAKDQANG